jgi:hypothetical protein
MNRRGSGEKGAFLAKLPWFLCGWSHIPGARKPYSHKAGGLNGIPQSRANLRLRRFTQSPAFGASRPPPPLLGRASGRPAFGGWGIGTRDLGGRGFAALPSGVGALAVAGVRDMCAGCSPWPPKICGLGRVGGTGSRGPQMFLRHPHFGFLGVDGVFCVNAQDSFCPRRQGAEGPIYHAF